MAPIPPPRTQPRAALLAALVRRRTVWLPTLTGWLLLFAVVAGPAVVAGRGAYRWLALDAPARGPDGRGAPLLVVEGWLNPYELQDAVRVFRAGHYERIVTTGGPSRDWPESPLPTTFADRAAGYLVRHGIAADRVVAIPAPDAAVDRTYASAVQVRDWLRRQPGGVSAIDVFTAGTHARRSRMLYRMAFGPSVEVGALTSRAVGHDPARWWASSEAAKLVLAETLSTVWTVCCFWPPRPAD